MAAKKRKILNYRQLKVAEIWERDPEQTLKEIALILRDEFGIKRSIATISRDLKALDERNLAKSDAIITSVKTQLTDEYQYIYGEAMSAWLQSLEDKEQETKEAILTNKNNNDSGEDKPNRIKQVKRVEGQSGNPALLAQAQAAMKSIRELWGLDAQKDDPGSSEEKPLIIKVIKGVSIDDI